MPQPPPPAGVGVLLPLVEFPASSRARDGGPALTPTDAEFFKQNGFLVSQPLRLGAGGAGQTFANLLHLPM